MCFGLTHFLCLARLVLVLLPLSAVLCCAVLCCAARGRSLQTPPEQTPALFLTGTHRGMLSPCGLETSASLSVCVCVCACVFKIHLDADARTNTRKNACTGAAGCNCIVANMRTHSRAHSHTYSKHILSQICILLIPSTLLRLLLLSSPCLSGVIVSILLHQGAPEGYKLNINANALSHCPPPPPSSPTHTHTPIVAIQTDQCVCELIGEQWAFFNEREREIRVAKPQRGTPRAAAEATA